MLSFAKKIHTLSCGNVGLFTVVVVSVLLAFLPFTAHGQTRAPAGYNVNDQLYFVEMWGRDTAGNLRWENGWTCTFQGGFSDGNGTCKNVDGREASCKTNGASKDCAVTKAGDSSKTPAPVLTNAEIANANTVGSSIPFVQMYTRNASGNVVWNNGWTCDRPLSATTAGRSTCTNSIDGRVASCISDGNTNPCQLTKAGDPSKLQTQAAREITPPSNTPAADPSAAPDGCNLVRLDICVKNGITWSISLVVGGLAYVVLAIASFLLWIVGGLFNWVVIKTVFQFGSTFGTSEGMLIAWGILRDIGNIVLLFSFIFMGLATILNTHALDEYSARKALPRLIIFAVLLNFSLFAAQIVIDVSNSMAAVFTAQAGDLGCSNASADNIDAGEETAGGDSCANDGIAGRVMQMAGVTSVWDATDIGEFMTNPAKHAPVFIGLALFVTITAVVLLAAAIMLIFRAVMLCLLMVLSPIGFAGMAVPPLQKFAHDWWNQLIKNAFFAPIYLLLVLISLKIVEGLIGPNDNGSFAKAMIEGSTNAPQVFVVFAVVIAFMVASLMVANKMGVAGAKFATERAGKLIGGATLGSVGFIGRRTLGNASLAAGGAIRRSRYLTEVNPNLGRLLAKGADKGANASYSVRGLATKVGAGAGLDFGKASKDVSHGIHGIEEKAVKERLEYAKSFKGRIENDKDVEERIATAKAQRKAAAEIIPERLATENAARLEQEKAEAEADKQATIVRQLRRQADNTLRSTGRHDAVTEEKLAAAEKELKKKESTLASADKKLSDASSELAKAREGEAKAATAAADTSYKRISSKDQQERYADSIAHKGLGYTVTKRDGSEVKWFTPTLAVHVNHEAAEKIKKNANKSDIEKALDTIKEKTEKKDDDHKDDDHGGGHGGGAQKPAGGGGGGHPH